MPTQTGSLDLSGQKKAHDEAAKVATNYISVDSTGMMVADGDGTETPSTATTRNVFIDSDSVEIRDGLESRASFGEVVRIGKEYVSGATDNEGRIEIDYRSLKLLDKDNYVYFSVSDLRDRSGVADVANRFIGDGSTTQFWISPTASNTSYDVTVDGVAASPTKAVNAITFGTAPADGAVIDVDYQTESQDAIAFTFGQRGAGNVGAGSFATGTGVVASGVYSHAEGYNTTASGRRSHAEGFGTTASNRCSHAEGYNTTASGYGSHSEGFGTTASGHSSHAEGYNTTASGNYSHAQNYHTVAQGNYQTVVGRHNVADSTSALIIGNGNSTNSSNALTVDWNGNVKAAGEVKASGDVTASGDVSAVNVNASGDVTATGDISGSDVTASGDVTDGSGNVLSDKADAADLATKADVTDLPAIQSLVPIGTLLDFAGSTAPSGYLVCDGSAVSRSTYAALFAVIGTTWGAGDGSTTFNIPDFRGRTAIGAGTGTGGNATAHALGSTGGDEAMQSHTHAPTTTAGWRFQGIKPESGVTGSYNLQTHGSGANRYTFASTNSSDAFSYWSATASTGDGSSGNLPPFATVTKIIRAI